MMSRFALKIFNEILHCVFIEQYFKLTHANHRANCNVFCKLQFVVTHWGPWSSAFRSTWFLSSLLYINKTNTTEVPQVSRTFISKENNPSSVTPGTFHHSVEEATCNKKYRQRISIKFKVRHRFQNPYCGKSFCEVNLKITQGMKKKVSQMTFGGPPDPFIW